MVMERDEQGYTAYCPVLEGWQSHGHSLEEALTNIEEAVELYLETLSPGEARQMLSQEILTTSVGVSLGSAPRSLRWRSRSS